MIGILVARIDTVAGMSSIQVDKLVVVDQVIILLGIKVGPTAIKAVE